MRPIPETVDIEMLKCPHLSKADRFQHKEHMIGLPPNRHTLTDNNLAKIVQKSTGKKGPYACFTGNAHFCARTVYVRIYVYYCKQYL